MKYIEICLVLLMVNLTASLFLVTGIWPGAEITKIDSPEPVDIDGELLSNETLAYKVAMFSSGQAYTNPGIQNTNQQYLRAGGDFLRGLNYFYQTLIKGTVLVKPTLMAFGVPENITFYIVYPIYFLYALAVIQIVSGRNFGGAD